MNSLDKDREVLSNHIALRLGEATVGLPMPEYRLPLSLNLIGNMRLCVQQNYSATHIIIGANVLPKFRQLLETFTKAPFEGVMRDGTVGFIMNLPAVTDAMLPTRARTINPDMLCVMDYDTARGMRNFAVAGLIA